MNKKKIVFMGTPKFAVPVLEMLIENYGVDLVITQPDKKVGRKKVLTPPPVKVVALDNNIKVLQPEKISTDEETYNTLKELNPDIIITAAYGQLVPEKILEIPKHKCINVHGSLLPKLRGGAPIQYSILEDHKKTGITIMYMVKKLDAGDMISKVEVDILDSDNYESLHDKLSVAGRDLLNETLPKIFSGDIAPEKQDDNLANYAEKLTKEEAKLDWNLPACQLERNIRAFNPAPIAFLTVNVNGNDERVKIYQANVLPHQEKALGTVIAFDKTGLQIATQDGVLNITQLQPQGKKPMSVQDFLNGRADWFKVGELLA